MYAFHIGPDQTALFLESSPTHGHPQISPCDPWLNAVFLRELAFPLVFFLGGGLGREGGCYERILNMYDRDEGCSLSANRSLSCVWMRTAKPHLHGLHFFVCRLRKFWEGRAGFLEVAVCWINTSNYRVPVQPWKDWTSMENQFDNYLFLEKCTETLECKYTAFLQTLLLFLWPNVTFACVIWGH